MRIDPSNIDEEIREDIATAREEPDKLYTLKHWKNPRVIIAAVEENPNMLEEMQPSNGLTPEILDELLKRNEWLYKHPYYNYVQNDPNFFEFFVKNNPSYITEIPFELVTDELIRIAFTKNPNILQWDEISPALKTRMKAQIQDYEDAPIPRSLERQISATHSNQGNQGVCGRHAFSRVIVKNFFELILPLQADRSREKDCSEFLLTTSPEEHPDSLRKLTPQKCSFSGYIKILLFLHCFFLFQKHISTVEGRPTGWLQCVQVSDLYKHLYTSIEIPSITHDQLYDLQDALYTLQTVQKKYNISLVTFHFKDITLKNIKKITEHGLYIMLRIEDSKSEELHSAHFVIIVGAFDEYMLVKNSWDKDTIYKIKFGYPFYLAWRIYDVLTDCSFVIPVQQPHNEEFDDLTHVDLYLQRYAELKTSFNKIVVNVINKSCPSRNVEPVECDSDHPFRQQSRVFHPDKNPRCRKEAELKFQQLNSLKGCREKSPVQSLGLIGMGKTKGKKSLHKKTRRVKR